jgi:thiosulfate/3-mercaptopyruvate sulfurtransferase
MNLRKMKKLIILSAILISSMMMRAQVTITAKDFASELKSNKSLVVIDVMAADVYAKQHVAGAINIPHKNLYKEGAIEGQLKSPEELAAIFGKKGVSNTSKIIVYDDGSQKYNSRVWWILKYIGAENVQLLHKNMTAWEQARIPLTNTATTLKPAVFTLNVNTAMNIQIPDVKALKLNPNAVLLDAREKDEYEGADKDQRSKGHLPGAIWMNYKEVLNADGSFKTKDEVIAAAAKHGAIADKEVVVYCQTGIKASTVYVALKEIAGFSNVKLYAGAYAEWASMNENPFCDKKLVADHQ